MFRDIKVDDIIFNPYSLKYCSKIVYKSSKNKTLIVDSNFNTPGKSNPEFYEEISYDKSMQVLNTYFNLKPLVKYVKKFYNIQSKKYKHVFNIYGIIDELNYCYIAVHNDEPNILKILPKNRYYKYSECSINTEFLYCIYSDERIDNANIYFIGTYQQCKQLVYKDGRFERPDGTIINSGIRHLNTLIRDKVSTYINAPLIQPYL